MDIEEKERLTGFRDTSELAVSRRLAAGRIVTGLGQRELAEAIGMNHKTYAYQEKSGRPAIAVVRYLYRNYGIDFNFVLHGDFQHLHPSLQASLFEALSSLAPSGDLRTSSR